MSDDQQLGGRLPLLPRERLTAAQSALHAQLSETRGARGRAAGYSTELSDGSLIGPFNAFLRVPRIAGPQLRWAEAISQGGLLPETRETAILTVGGIWRSEYELYAHGAAAAAAGIPAEVIAALSGGEATDSLAAQSLIAHRLTRALLIEHAVDDDLYRTALDAFGEAGLVTLVELIGQYITTAAVLACFAVPAPTS